MKAIRLHKPEDPKALIYEDAPKPQPKEEEVLIHVHAAGVSPAELSWGHLSRPLPIPGHELSGTIAELGANVKDHRPGEEVYGFTSFNRDGAFAEYTIALTSEIGLKPHALSHEEAAAVPLSALTAWQALFDHAHLQAEQTILIHAAAGGVGTFALQFAKWQGAYVIGTASTRNLDFLKQLGADQAIDYKTANFQNLHDIDAVLDAVGGETLERSWSVLRKGGALVSIVDNPSKERAIAQGVNSTYFVVRSDKDQLNRIAKLIDEGHVKPIIDKILPLSEAASAFDPHQNIHTRGKIVLQIPA